MDKFPQIGGMGKPPDSLKMKDLSGKRYNPANPYCLAKVDTNWQMIYSAAKSWQGAFLTF